MLHILPPTYVPSSLILKIKREKEKAMAESSDQDFGCSPPGHNW
jgi:hypothetical protein